MTLFHIAPATTARAEITSPNNTQTFQDVISDLTIDPIDSTTDTTLEKSESATGPKQAVIGLEAQGYMYSPQTKEAEVLPSVWGKLKTQGELFNGVEGHISLQALAILPPAGSGFYFEAPELYAGTPLASNVDFKVEVGRKLEHWNLLDERWQLGIWQPRFLWDYIHPEEVGLSGAYVTYESPVVRVVLFGSYLFIPERGVDITIQNGQLTSQSPFFVSPPSQATVLNQPTPIDYQLDVPSISSIVLRPSGGALVHIGEDTGPWFQAAGAFLPMNQLIEAYTAQLVVNQNVNSPDTGVATIYPRVTNHWLLSVETGYQVGILSTSISSLWDVPIQQTVPANYTSQEVSNSIAVSPSLDLRFHVKNWGTIHGYASYLAQAGGNASDYSGNSSTNVAGASSSFDVRYPYQQAFMIGGEGGVPGASYLGAWADHVSLSGRWLYDLGHKGTILSMDVRYQPIPRWQVNVGADLLGSSEQLPQGTLPADLIGRYQANDDFRGGLSYAF
jgi:hypothetical protein